jgi:hypothetical protein
VQKAAFGLWVKLLRQSARKNFDSTGLSQRENPMRYSRLFGKLVAGLVLCLTVETAWLSIRGRLVAPWPKGHAEFSTMTVRTHPQGNLTSVTPADRGATDESQNATTQVSKTYGKLPLSFEANQGQVDRRVKFFSRGTGYGLFLTSTEVVLQCLIPDSKSLEKERG